MSTSEKRAPKEQTWADESLPDVSLPGETKGGTARSVSTMSASSSDADILSFASSAAISDFRTHKCNPFYDVRWFVFFFYIVTLSIYAILAHNVAIARTLEVRFGLSSFQVGFISSFNDIINLILVLFIGYFGGKFSKPRMLGVMCIIGAFGCMLFALPYALYPRDISEELLELNANESKSRWFCGAVNETICEDEDENEISNRTYGIMLIAAALLGFGNAGLSILSVGYIDDNLPRNAAAFYIGIVSSAYPVGPLLGFIVSTITLEQPENLDFSYLSPDDTGFIGCWWLAYLIFGSLVLFSAIPMLFCPKHLPHYYKMKIRLRKLKKLRKLPSIEDVKARGLKQKTEVAVESMKGVLTNVPYMTLVMSTLCCYYILPSIYQQVPKYLNIQFHIPPSTASIYTGLSGALVSAVSLVIVGWVVKKLKLQTRGACALLILSICGTQLAITAMLPWECDQALLAGAQAARYDDSALDEYYPQCQSNCNCTGVLPVCNDRLEIAFVSPCHAGCEAYNPRLEIFVNCSCVVNDEIGTGGWGGPVKEGLCEKDECNEYIYYLLGFAAFNIFTSMTRIGGLIVQLRLVEKEMRSFTLGITSFIHNGLVFIPGPIIFGSLYDSTCLLWEKLDCTNEDGVCFLYNMPQYRTYMHGIPLTILLGGLLLSFLLFCMIRRRTKNTKKDPESEESDHGEPPRFGGGLGSSDKGQLNLAYEDPGGVSLTSADDTIENVRF